MTAHDRIRDELCEEIRLGLESIAADRVRSGHFPQAQTLADAATYHWAVNRMAEIIQRRFSVRRKGGKP